MDSTQVEELFTVAALFSRFDASLLATVLDRSAEEAEIARWLETSDLVELQSDEIGGYSLSARGQEKSQALDSLSQQNSPVVRARGFQEMLRRFLESPAVPQSQHYADAVMAQLYELFYLLIQGGTDRLLSLVAEAEEAKLEPAEHRDWLAFYRACCCNQLSRFEEAEKLFGELLGRDTGTGELTARIAGGAGVCFELMDHLDLAIDCYQQSLKAYEEIDELSGQAKMLYNMGIVYLRRGEYNQCSGYYERSVSLARQAGNIEQEAMSYNELGYTAQEQGKYKEALKNYQKSLEIWEKLDKLPQRAMVLNNVGETYHYQGDLEGSEKAFQEALEISRDYQMYADRADILKNLALLSCSRHQLDEARDYLEESISVSDTAKQPALACEIQFCYGTVLRELHENVGAMRAFEEAVHHLEVLSIRVQNEETRIGVRGLRHYVFQAIVLLCLDLGRIEAAFAYVEQAKARVYLDALHRSSSRDKLPSVESLKVEEIRERLPSGMLLAAYFSTGSQTRIGEKTPTRAPEPIHRLSSIFVPEEKILVFLMRKEDPVEVVEIQTSARKIRVTHFRGIDGRLQGISNRLPARLGPFGRWHDMDRQLVAPIRPWFEDAGHVIFSPHDSLHLLPLHALNPEFGDFAGPTTVSYAPSVSIVLARGLDTDPTIDASTALVVGVNNGKLLHTETEAKKIGELWGVEPLVGERGTVDGVLARLPGSDLIHIACHGQYSNENPMSSFLQLYGGKLSADRIRAQAGIDAKLVVLSACDTGVNLRAPGDELLGLTRAFLGAGARSVLVTLWPVHDVPTELFMEHFYQAWQSGLSRARAMQQAQNYLRRLDEGELRQRFQGPDVDDRSKKQVELLCRVLPGRPFDHPLFWGSFLLIGDPS